MIMAFLSCEKSGVSDCFQSAGKTIEFEADLPEFDTITLDDVFDVFLIQDTVNKMIITGGENIVNNVEYLIINNNLILNNQSVCTWTKPANNKVHLYIHFKSLSRIVLNKSCKIRSINEIEGIKFGIIMKDKYQDVNIKANVNDFYFWNNSSCGGEIIIAGSCHQLSFWSTNLIRINALDFQSNNVFIHSRSMNDIFINVHEKLECTILNKGNVYYLGSPEEIVLNVIGTGRLIKL